LAKIQPEQRMADFEPKEKNFRNNWIYSKASLDFSVWELNLLTNLNFYEKNISVPVVWLFTQVVSFWEFYCITSFCENASFKRFV